MKLVNMAMEYNQLHGFNVLPLIDKVPQGEWTHWQNELMNPEDICAFNWQNINGIGSVSGINKLRCLDFDNVTDVTVIKEFLLNLGLSPEYRWAVISGSGKGYHIWFCCDDDPELFNFLGGEKSYYKFTLKEKKCDHIELRWKKCQTVLPPSLHPSGKKYKFLFNGNGEMPEKSPTKISVEKLCNTLQYYCVLPKKKSMGVCLYDCLEEKKKENGVWMNDCMGKKKDENGVGMDEDTQAGKPVLHGAMDESDSELENIAEFLSGRISNYDDWMRIGFALASLGEQGRKYFIQISSNNSEYNDTEEQLNSKFDGFLKDYRGDISLGTLYEIAKQYGYGENDQHFWHIQNEKVRLFSNRLIEFLESEGYGKMIVNKDYIFIRDTDNVISEISKINIKDHVLSYIYNNSEGNDRSLLLEHFIRNAGVLCGERTLECLHTIKPDLISGTKVKEYFFFKNCFIEVTKDEIKQKDYSELQGKIWEKQKAQHDFYFTNDKSEFEKFIENICRQDDKRISALRSAIGYLLVSYKDPSSAKAVIFIDEKLSDNAFGRSGKGLVSKAISSMKNVLKIDGKNFSFDRSFMFQAVDQDTQLILFDDVKKKFSFEKLFSILTEGITIEKKNKNEYRVPYERSPKILITTNHTVEGSDDSSIDRQFVVEFSDYYNAKYKPKDEFGHLFFDEWTEEQWAAFYNYMAECCRYYLKYGLKNYEYVNLTKKKLIDSTAPEFEEFISELELNKEYIKKELFERFKKEYEDFGQMKYNTLSKWTKIYADLYNLDIIERKSGTERFMFFRKKGEISLKSKLYPDRKIKTHDPL